MMEHLRYPIFVFYVLENERNKFFTHAASASVIVICRTNTKGVELAIVLKHNIDLWTKFLPL